MTLFPILRSVAFALLLAGPALAQLPLSGPSSGGPVSIDAEKGIEWRRDEKLYIASGGARVQRGGVTLTAQTLRAYYKELPDGQTQITKVEADKDVIIVTATERVVGDKGVYDLERQVMVLTGTGLKLTTQTQTITARDSLEYWDGRKVAVARGNAVAVEADRRISADVLTAHLATDASGKANRISKLDGFGNLAIATPKEAASSEKGVYDMDRQIATLLGTVKVTQGKNQLNGDYAEVNLKTGVSRILRGTAAGREGAPVRGLLVPNATEAPANRADAAGKGP
ncbi:MAG: LptA/OstA family protein [Elstera sp.]